MLLKWHTANEPNFFLFVCFGHPVNVLNQLARENQVIDSQYIVLPMYLNDYVQESVHEKDPVTSRYGHNCAKHL
jgi:hypothetical protein